MALAYPVLANVAANAGEFFTNLFTGALTGDFLSLLVISIVALVILRFTVAKWLFNLVKQIVIFGGLAFAVWFGSQAISTRYGETPGQVVLYGGGALVAILFFIMLYMFFLRRSREKAAAAGAAPRQGATLEAQKSTMRVGAGPLAGHGLPVHYQEGATPAGAGATGSAAQTQEATKMEETLKKMNLLGAAKEQNLITVAVLIVVAQFGVFTSFTLSAPEHRVGLFLFIIFIALAVVYVKTAYKNYLKGITHFTFAIIFALLLSTLMLHYWQQTFLCGDFPEAAAITAECIGAAATDEAQITWMIAADPRFYFASDGLIAAISGVAFSTLLTKAGS